MHEVMKCVNFKQHDWIVMAMGEKWIVTLVLAVSQFAVGALTYMRLSHKHLKHLHGACNPISDPQYTFNPLIMNVFYLIIVVWEVALYVNIYSYIHQMDLQIKPHISEQEQRKRKVSL